MQRKSRVRSPDLRAFGGYRHQSDRPDVESRPKPLPLAAVRSGARCRDGKKKRPFVAGWPPVPAWILSPIPGAIANCTVGEILDGGHHSH